MKAQPSPEYNKKAVINAYMYLGLLLLLHLWSAAQFWACACWMSTALSPGLCRAYGRRGWTKRALSARMDALMITASFYEKLITDCALMARLQQMRPHARLWRAYSSRGRSRLR